MNVILSGTNYQSIIRGATLIYGFTVLLDGILTYPRHLTCASRRRIIGSDDPFTAPSAVHLLVCFLPDSQHRRLSVKASPVLSPHQRFVLLLIF